MYARSNVLETPYNIESTAIILVKSQRPDDHGPQKVTPNLPETVLGSLDRQEYQSQQCDHPELSKEVSNKARA